MSGEGDISDPDFVVMLPSGTLFVHIDHPGYAHDWAREHGFQLDTSGLLKGWFRRSEDAR